MINKKWLWLMIFVFLISFISASISSLGTFKQNTPVRLVQTCADCSYVNITSIIYPNSTIVLSDIPMTKNGTDYYYNVNASYNTLLGTYLVNGIGDEGGSAKIWTYVYEITPSGRDKPNSGEGITFLTSVIAMILISAIFFFISGSFKGNDNALTGSPEAKGNPAARFFFISISFIVGIITMLYIMVALTETYAGFNSIINSFTSFQYIILSVFFVMFIFVLVNLSIKVLEAMRIKKGIMRRKK